MSLIQASSSVWQFLLLDGSRASMCLAWMGVPQSLLEAWAWRMGCRPCSVAGYSRGFDRSNFHCVDYGCLVYVLLSEDRGGCIRDQIVGSLDRLVRNNCMSGHTAYLATGY